ncbi:MAG: hypothetical protein HDQ87_05420 [Clostridia bacterium]|nr:hypothetical protein [Clostridia bacterium]
MALLTCIVKELVGEAASLSEQEIEHLAADCARSNAEHVSCPAMEPDTVQTSGLFALKVPSEWGTVYMSVNIISRNAEDLPVPAEQIAMIETYRQLDQLDAQCPDFGKLYTVWIIAEPEKDAEGTCRRFVSALQQPDGTLESVPAEMDVYEVCILSLGRLDEDAQPSPLFRLLDTIFSGAISEDERQRALDQQ